VLVVDFEPQRVDSGRRLGQASSQTKDSASAGHSANGSGRPGGAAFFPGGGMSQAGCYEPDLTAPTFIPLFRADAAGRAAHKWGFLGGPC
jgi:hypothetical protein